MTYRVGNFVRLHHRLDGYFPVSLHDTLGHTHRKLGQRVADVDLPAGNVVFAAIERQRFGQSGNRMFSRGVRRGIGARGMGRNRAIIDDASALG